MPVSILFNGLHIPTAISGLLQNPNNERESIETLEYFLNRLGSHQTHQRLRALKGLRLVLSSDGAAVEAADAEGGVEMVAMEVDGTRIDSSNDWLLQKLPSLPCFNNFYPRISHQESGAKSKDECKAAIKILISGCCLIFRSIPISLICAPF